MNASELSAILSGLGPGLHAAVDKAALAAAAPLLVRIAELEAKVAAIPEGKQGPQGIPGDPGAAVPMQVLQNMVEIAVGEAMSKLPPAKDGERGAPGEDGKDGTSVTLQDVQPWISEEIGRQLALVLDKAMPAQAEAIRAEILKAVAEIPAPRDGAPGKDGASVSLEDVQPLVNVAVLKSVAALPPPKDGRDGIDGVPGKDGASVTAADVEPLVDAIVAKKVAALPPPKEGAPGRDGRDVDLALVNAAVAEAVRREVAAIQKPRDGVDGFAPDDFDASLAEDGRTVKFTLRAGEREITRAVKLALTQYRGIWREGDYESGDIVTWAGSAFVATRDTKSKPETDDSWRLFVKRGRDGKDGKNGERGERGLPAPQGGSVARA